MLTARLRSLWHATDVPEIMLGSEGSESESEALSFETSYKGLALYEG
jgi:hypothetical protein